MPLPLLPLILAGGALTLIGARRLLDSRRAMGQQLTLPQGPQGSTERFNPAASLDLSWTPTPAQLARNTGLAWTNLGIALLSLALPPLRWLCLPLLALMSVDIFHQGYRDLVESRRFTLPGLIAVLTAAAVFQGYIVAVSVAYWFTMLLYQLLFTTQYHVQNLVVGLFDDLPQRVWGGGEGVEVPVPLDQVQTGETVVVSAGEVVPLDGVITAGTATLDQQRLTGEAQPIERSVGDEVLAAAVVVTGRIELRVLRSGRDSVIASIKDTLNHTAEYRYQFETQSRRIGDGAALPVLLLGVLTLPLRGPSGALAVLGSNLGLNVAFVSPLIMLNFLRQGLRQGVLIKDARVLEILSQVDTVVFDKTGTLTHTEPLLGAIYPAATFDEDGLLALAAAAEGRLEHPIARAIRAAAAARGVVVPPVEAVNYRLGFGVEVRILGRTVRLGSVRHMADNAIAIPAPLAALEAQGQRRGHTWVYLAVDDVLGGAFEIHPAPREEAREIVAALGQRGLETYLLSGDQEAPTQALAEALAIDHWIAGALPADKARHIEALQRRGRRVCFVGDGINDAIAMKTAHVAISLQGATALAVDSAHVVFLDGTLEGLPALLDLAGRYDRYIKGGIVIGLAPGVLCIGGVLLFNIGYWSAVGIYSAGLLGGAAYAMLPRLAQALAEIESTEPGGGQRPPAGRPARR